jgi:hypothetical protein
LPDIGDIMTYGTGVGSDKSATSFIVEGTMRGEGKVEIEIRPTSSLLDVVRRAEAVLKHGRADQHQRSRFDRAARRRTLWRRATVAEGSAAGG